MSNLLKEPQRAWVIQQLMFNKKRKEIQDEFAKRYGRSIHIQTIGKLAKSPQVQTAIVEGQANLMNNGAALGPAVLNSRVYRQIDTKLRWSEEDISAVDELRAKLHSGQINRTEFDREVVKYESLTIMQLVKISDSLHKQSLKTGEDPPLTPQDQAAFQLLVEGIRNGNPMQLIQVLNPNAGNPAPPVGTQAQPAS